MSISWRRPAVALATSVALLGSLFMQTGTASAVAATPSVVINEVESSGGTPVDWIELKNTGATSVDLSGYILRDNVDTDAVTIASGTTVAPGGYLAVDVDITGGFGLGASDSARLFMPDGTTLVDSYTWTSHASTTYGRCPDGTGAFATTLASTKGAANSCAVPATAANSIVINEVESSGGTPVDWIELKNNAAVAVDASGLILRDNVDADIVTVPANTTIAAGGYLAVDVDVAGGFGLGGSDSARLFDTDGTTLIDSYTWTAHAKVTYGRCPDGTGSFIDTFASTKGAANSCSAPVTTANVVINEIESSGGTPGDWVELKNVGTTTADVSGYQVKDNGETNTVTIPAATTISAGAYYTVDMSGLGDADSARLFAADGTTLVDSYTWATAAAMTYGRCPDGTGAFVNTAASTKNVVNNCPAPSVPNVKINEINSSGSPDWVELYNAGSTTVDLTGWKFLDGDATHTAQVLPTASIAPGGYYTIDSTLNGLGAPDAANLYLPDGTTLVDSYSWTVHPAFSDGRCPNGTGDFAPTASLTRNAPNDCVTTPDASVVLNEVDSNDDWVELTNVTAAPIDISGDIVKDNDDTHSQVIPANTTLAAGAFYALDVTAFGLGDADSARLFSADGTTLLDSYTWTTAAATSYGRQPDGTGAFQATFTTSKGAANVFGQTWPGGASVNTVDETGLVTSNLSGLDYDGDSANGPLWAVDNGPSTLFRLVKSEAGTWVSDTANGWSAGKALRYPDGTGDPDTEGVTVTDAGASAGVYVSTERNNSDSTVSRPEVLRYDVTGSGTTLSATNEWNLTADLPTLGANLGAEAVTWIPDHVLVAEGFVDTNTGAVYNPASYPGHGSGLFFVGIEQNGLIYAYALNNDNTYNRIASFSSGFPAVMDLQYDPETGHLWAGCDDTCNGNINILDVAQSGSTAGQFGVTTTYLRPAGMPNYNNEGFALAPQALCVDGEKPVFWSDDTDDGGHSLREGTVDCDSLLTSTPTPTIGGSGAVDSPLTASAGTWAPDPVTLGYQWSRNGVDIAGATGVTYTPAASDLGSSITVTVTGTKDGYTTVATTSAATTVTVATFAATPVPLITGSGVFGTSLTADSGAWSPAPVTLAYQWLIDGAPIAGATSGTYSPVASDVAKSITVTVTGTRAGYTNVSRNSLPVVITAAGFATSPVPTISGTVEVGHKLTAKVGTWAPAPVVLSYRWTRNGVSIAGATASIYTLTKTDAGKRLAVIVTGAREGFTSVAKTSSSTVTVKSAFAKTSHVVIRGKAKVGTKLTAATGTWSPKAKFAYRWYANGKPIAGATHSSYRVTKSVKGKKLTVRLTGARSGYVSVVKTSAASAKVR